MRRRSYIALTAAALSTPVAGCTGSPGGSGETTRSTTNSTTTGTARTTTTAESNELGTVELRDALVQPGVVLLQTDYLTVASSGGQYLLADVAVTGGEAPRDAFAFRFDGQTYAPRPKRETRRLWRVYNRGEYDPTTGGLLVFQLPATASSEDPETVLEFGSWEREVPSMVQSRLATENPEFTVDATVTSPIEVGESPRVTLTVENTSDVGGRFVAGLNRSGPMVASMPAARISLPVEGGAVAEFVHEPTDVTGVEVPDGKLDDGEADLTFRLRTLDASTRLDVAYQSASD